MGRARLVKNGSVDCVKPLGRWRAKANRIGLSFIPMTYLGVHDGAAEKGDAQKDGAGHFEDFEATVLVDCGH